MHSFPYRMLPSDAKQRFLTKSIRKILKFRLHFNSQRADFYAELSVAIHSYLTTSNLKHAGIHISRKPFSRAMQRYQNMPEKSFA